MFIFAQSSEHNCVFINFRVASAFATTLSFLFTIFIKKLNNRNCNRLSLEIVRKLRIAYQTFAYFPFPKIRIFTSENFHSFCCYCCSCCLYCKHWQQFSIEMRKTEKHPGCSEQHNFFGRFLYFCAGNSIKNRNIDWHIL